MVCSIESIDVKLIAPQGYTINRRHVQQIHKTMPSYLSAPITPV